MPEAGELAGRAVEHDSAANQHEPLDDVLDRAELVRDVEDRDAELGAKLLEQGSERLLGLGVHAGRRLVEREQRRLRGERLGDERPLLQPPESSRNGVVGAVSRARRGRWRASTTSRSARRSGPTTPLGASRPAETTSRTVAGASPPSERPLWQVADARAALVGRARRPPKTDTVPAMRTLEPEDEAQQRRLAAAVRAGDGNELACGDTQRDAVEHEDAVPVRRTRRRRARRAAAG